jgi:pimeloyl-ACP methyl ester carboxylesterase
MMNYEVKGDGIPLLLIHGFPLNHTLWDSQAANLCEIARVITPDLRGFGASNPVQGIYSMDLLAQDCRELLDHLGIHKPVVIGGLSMGGYIAFAFYRLFSERVRGLILAATRAGTDTPEGKANRENSARLVSELGISVLIDAMLPKMMASKTYAGRPSLVESVRKMMETTSVEGAIGAQLGMKDRSDSTPTLLHITQPTLILHGDGDQLVPLGEAERMQAAIDGSQLTILPDAGHLLNLEQPDLFNQAVRQFLTAL